VIWDPAFYQKFPGYAGILPIWSNAHWPQLNDYNKMAHNFACPISFIAQSQKCRYEKVIYESRLVPTRLNHWHDFFNNLTWLQWPKIKWAMIQRYYEEGLSASRTPLQNILAHFDECGVIICSENLEVFEHIQQMQWKTLFWHKRNLLAHCQCIIIGHGLLDKARAPYIGMTGKTIFLPYIPASLKIIDEVIAQTILSTSLALMPFPLLGWPVWHADNQYEEFYDNTDYFRAKR